jgi:hypothetical protein
MEDMEGITTAIEDEIVINRVVGPVKTYKILEYIEQNVESWKQKPVIWDLDKADFSNMNTDIWQEFVLKLEPLSYIKKGEKTALFASKDLPFGMMRMVDILAKPLKFKFELRTFRSIEKAKEWLLE